jgi:hypothetical protein
MAKVALTSDKIKKINSLQTGLSIFTIKKGKEKISDPLPVQNSKQLITPPVSVNKKKFKPNLPKQKSLTAFYKDTNRVTAVEGVTNVKRTTKRSPKIVPLNTEKNKGRKK